MLRTCAVLGLVCGLLVVASPPLLAKDSKAKQQAKIRDVANSTLKNLYKINPTARTAIEKAAGYAVFNNFGMKILVAGGGSGKGVAVNNQSKREVFMKMVEVQAGLGFGVKKFNLVWVFETSQALDQFVDSGWEMGGQATAAATVDGQGGSLQGALAIAPGVWLYQITDKGLALELTVKGTKYTRDDDLN
jgi:lipid-binding SYLF domain-containing protein